MKDYSSIIVSSTAHLFRNLVGFKFPSMLEGDEGIKVLNKVADNILPLDSSFKLYKIKSLPELDVNIMREKKLISSKLLDACGYGAVVLNKSEDLSIMINEMDHIHEQFAMSGLNLIKAYDKLSELDNQILSKLDIAYDDSLGFMTSSLSMVGTGLKCSITLFLPALTLSGKIQDIISTIISQGFDVNKINDELDYEAYTYVLSNSSTIGKKENEYIVKLSEIAIQVAEIEVKARTELLSIKYVDDVKDKVYRAWGLLTNAHKIKVDEASKLLGELKMGIALDLIRFKDLGVIDELMTNILPYSLTQISDSKVADSELDKFRAKFLTNVLKSKRIK